MQHKVAFLTKNMLFSGFPPHSPLNNTSNIFFLNEKRTYLILLYKLCVVWATLMLYKTCFYHFN
jgi:hypothetical protein